MVTDTTRGVRTERLLPSDDGPRYVYAASRLELSVRYSVASAAATYGVAVAVRGQVG